MVFYNIYIHWTNRHDELLEDVGQIMGSNYGFQLNRVEMEVYIYIY